MVSRGRPDGSEDYRQGNEKIQSSKKNQFNILPKPIQSPAILWPFFQNPILASDLDQILSICSIYCQNRSSSQPFCARFFKIRIWPQIWTRFCQYVQYIAKTDPVLNHFVAVFSKSDSGLRFGPDSVNMFSILPKPIQFSAILWPFFQNPNLASDLDQILSTCSIYCLNRSSSQPFCERFFKSRFRPQIWIRLCQYVQYIAKTDPVLSRVGIFFQL